MPASDDQDVSWLKLRQLASQWRFPAGTTYLNHGSFGATPTVVRQAKRRWQDQLDDQPMNFYVRELEPALFTAREALADFVDTDPSNLVFVENATYAMNVVAQSHPFEAGDEILMTDHEYGAVRRIWERRARRDGLRIIDATIPVPLLDHDQVLDGIFSKVTDRTRLIIVSHITSATAIILPIQRICERAKQQGLLVCVDGPHAIAQEDLSLDQLHCDFYTASCHKWLCAPLGSGFLYVHPDHQRWMTPPIQSWGRLLPALPSRWDEEFFWSGTRDPSGYLSVPNAIDFMEEVGLETFRQISHRLAQIVRGRLESLTGETAIVPNDRVYYGCMTEVPLPPGDWRHLQNWLWLQHGIEVPIIQFMDQWFIRVSCHLHTLPEHFDRLDAALTEAFEHPDCLSIHESETGVSPA